MKIIKILFWSLVLASASVRAEAPPPTPVTTTAAITTEIAPVIWMPGTVIARHDARIAAEVAGRLTEVRDVGDHVQAGDVIARIDSQTFELLRREASAAVDQIESRLAFNERELVRLRRLEEQNNAARNRLDEVESLRNQARDELRAARVRVELAQDRINKARLRAPFNGVITNRFKPAGERVDAGDEILRLVNTEDLEIQLSVPQSSIYHLKMGDKLIVRDTHTDVTATIRALVPVGDDRSRLYELRLSLPQTAWAAGHLVRVAVPVDAVRQVTAVPRDALVIRTDGTAVYRINEQSMAERLVVTTGIAGGDLIEVQGDVKPGDQIVIRGNERLRPGQAVTATPSTAQH